jgi:hypothetical protein
MVKNYHFRTIGQFNIIGFIKFPKGFLDYLKHPFCERIILCPMENYLDLLYYITSHQLPINFLNHITNR